MSNKESSLSRREFAKAAALTTAAALVPSELLTQETKPAGVGAKVEAAPAAQKLSAASQAEADLAYETLMKKYGNRFTDGQKKDIERLVSVQQGGLDKLRAFPVSNNDEPAIVFKPLIPEERR